MKIAFIGDIVGKPGRDIIYENLLHVRQDFGIDFVMANYENASHGFGLTLKNATELLSCGIDCMSGGNHTWDKKEILPLLDSMPLLRPINFPKTVPGVGYRVFDVGGEKLATINVLGHFAMPMVANPFSITQQKVEQLQQDGIKNIIIDFHAESTAEKRGLFLLLQSKVSAILGTHTHIGTDDLCIENGCAYVSDVGLSGCRDGIIGMDKEAPLQRMLTGLPASLEIPKNCKKIMQIIICEIEEGKCINAKKLRIYDDREMQIQEALVE
ncbi:MAG: YmdB family metallophosphoesterase [Sulfurospirillum sp.]|nr:YmdB family metallophosphoesterase [Sulfurospirillum sp.]